MLVNILIKVLNMSFVGSFVILVILIARIVLMSSPKIYSYMLWSAALIRLAIPISLQSIVSLIPIKSNPIPQQVLYSKSPTINTGSGVLNEALEKSYTTTETVVNIQSNQSQLWLDLGAVVWIIGMTIIIVYGIASLIKIKKYLYTSTHISNNLYLLNNINTPFILGITRPKIYLPKTVSYAEMDYIIFHEKVHIKRCDHIIRFLSYFVLCIHWFNPLVWLAFHLSGKDMEMSCDEAVIKHMGNDIKKDYSQSLLNFTVGKKNPGMTSLSFSEGDTKDRIKNILNFRKPNPVVILFSIFFVVFILLGVLSDPVDKDISKIVIDDHSAILAKSEASLVAEKFLNKFYIVTDEAREEYQYFYDISSVGSDERNKYNLMVFMADSYGQYFTDEGLTSFLNKDRYPLLIMDSAINANFTIQVNTIELEASLVEIDQEVYNYSISFDVLYSDQENEHITESGYINLLQADNEWKINKCRLGTTYFDQHLY